ncbi:hypothetical protein HPP92_018082 [Vanilla planifolia]|uniref:Uncharacterized protein n=1 Tax=Vanilla planifolia TaxID=51239 RepID=A0A835QAG5_VANPL|nr:hypothetical protein HPP92_018082 [Vanilla planifolia]
MADMGDVASERNDRRSLIVRPRPPSRRFVHSMTEKGLATPPEAGKVQGRRNLAGHALSPRLPSGCFDGCLQNTHRRLEVGEPRKAAD